jgi:hypothetical protein
MERSFYNDDFEELLKEKADQYKMYPSDKVWNGIQNSLHSKRKWYWIGFALLLSGVSYYAIEALIAPSKTPSNTGINVATSYAEKEAKKLSSKPKTSALVIPLPLSPNKIADRNESGSTINAPFYGVISIDKSYAHIDPSASVKVIHMVEVPQIMLDQKSSMASKQYSELPLVSSPLMSPANPSPAVSNAGSEFLVSVPDANNTVPGQQVRFPVENTPAEEDIRKINWLVEYALSELVVPKTKRISWQLAFSPTVNYRKLTTSKNPGRQYFVKNIPFAMNVSGDIDNLVNHKPAIGFELGSHMLYAADKNFTLKLGIQFNYSRYAIEAFSATTTDVATIALQSSSHLRRDSLTSFSNISNFGGNSVKDLQNQYFQLSAPIGLELRLIGKKRLQLHIAGTIQPTYLINRNTYLITTDYKNYTHEPSLVRRWNMNTSAEAFISYKTGGIRWQLGPQFRYQILSSYSKEYPIKENLMEYGVKIGVSKTIR